MRLTYISASTIPSATANSVHVMKMCEAFAEVGCDTLLVAFPGEESSEDPFTRYGVKPVFRLVRMPPFLPVLRNLTFCLRAVWIALARRSSIVYSRNTLAALLAAPLFRRVFLELHSPVAEPVKRTLLWLLHRAGLVRIVCISEALKQIVARDMGGVARIDVLHDGVNVDAFAYNAPPFTGRVLRLGYAGSLYRGRGIEIILKAFERIRALHASELVIAGGSAIEIEKLKEAGAMKGVTFLGHLPNRDIPSVLRTCDILLMPYQNKVSISSGELNTVDFMSPMKLFEYMAAGKLLVASDLPALREVIDEGTAILVRPIDSADAWAEALIAAIADRRGSTLRAFRIKRRSHDHSWRERARAIANRALE